MTSKPFKFVYPEGLDLHEKLALGVGALVIEWAVTETLFFALMECLAGRPGTDNCHVIWLSLRTTEARLGLIRHLSKIQPIKGVASEEIVKLCDRFKGVSAVRNFYCHSNYRDLDDGFRIENIALRNKEYPIVAKVKPLSAATLNEIAHAITETRRLSVDSWPLLLRLREATGTTYPEPPEGLDEYLRNQGNRPDPTTGP